MAHAPPGGAAHRPRCVRRAVAVPTSHGAPKTAAGRGGCEKSRDDRVGGAQPGFHYTQVVGRCDSGTGHGRPRPPAPELWAPCWGALAGPAGRGCRGADSSAAVLVEPVGRLETCGEARPRWRQLSGGSAANNSGHGAVRQKAKTLHVNCAVVCAASFPVPPRQNRARGRPLRVRTSERAIGQRGPDRDTNKSFAQAPAH
jgi:hypothetical protein